MTLHLKALTLIALTAFCLAACDGNGGIDKLVDDDNRNAPASDLSDSKAYKANSPYAEVLKGCVAVQSSACNFGTLPLLGMETSQPTIEAIMNRVIVSHDWMGQRFEEVLGILPPEMLLLFRGVTAIVIDADIRPAYYTTSTAAIYLDANFLWLSVNEANTINPKQDYRAGFSDPLQFRALNRYVKDNKVAYRYYAPDNASPRSLDDIKFLISSLLLHELAHANDFFPPAIHSRLTDNMTSQSAVNQFQSERVSSSLNNSNPLTSSTWLSLAGVMYKGDTANATHTSVTAAQAGSEFDVDGAADDYAYTSIFEDVAMLFEETMLLYLFDIERDQAFTAAPSDANQCSEYVIGWGTRRRIATAQVSARAELVANQILPEVNFDPFFSALGTTRQLPNGSDWCNSILFESQAGSLVRKRGAEHIHVDQVLPEQPFYH